MTPEGRAAKVVVIGGGVSGLAAAHRLIELGRSGRRPVEVTVLEASGRMGGTISTLWRDGFLLETGADAFITDKPWAKDLAARLGLSERLIGTLDAHRRSFIVRKGRLRPTPDGFQLIAPSRLVPFLATGVLSPIGKLRMAVEPLIARRPPADDESVGSFVRRRLGREALERIAQPMIGGIYGADAEVLSLRATFPRFLQMEEEHGSVLRALMASRRERPRDGASGPRYGLFATFDRGMGVLIETLAGRLAPGSCLTGSRARSIARTASRGWRVERDGGDPLEADAVILALRAPGAAGLLRRCDDEIAGMLSSIAYGSAATLHLAFRQRDVDHPMDGFGFVVPAVEGLSVIGATFVHRKFPGRAPDGFALIRAFWSDRSAQISDAEIIGRTLSDLRVLVGIRGSPRLTHLMRHPDSMPRYQVGHLRLIERIETALRRVEGLFLAGNAYRGVGIPDCVRSGETAAASAGRHLGLNVD